MPSLPPNSPFRVFIERFGEAKAAEYIRRHLRDPANVESWLLVFPNHVRKATPDFHRAILHEAVLPGRVAIAAPRGGAKSTVVDVVAAASLVLTGRKHFPLLISDTYSQAKLQLAALKHELETNPYIHWLYGDVIGDVWGEDRIIINTPYGEVMMQALGAGMKIRGLRFRQWRPDHVILDDLENSEAVASSDRRDKLMRWLQYDLLRALSSDNASITFLGTVLHGDALLKKAIDREGMFKGWRSLVFKAIQEDGTSLWPAQWPITYLRDIRDNPEHPDYVGTYVFAQEMQNEPQDDRDRIIKREWLAKYSLRFMVKKQQAQTDEERLKKWLSTLQVFGGVDPSISQKETADLFAFYTLGFDPKTGREYELDLIAGRFTIEEQVDIILKGFEKWGHEEIGIETVAYQEGLKQLVRSEAAKRRILGLRTRGIKTSTDKIRRARIHSVAFEGGFVLLNQEHEETEALKHELLEFPHGAHDDRFDALMLARETMKKPKARAFKKKPRGF